MCSRASSQILGHQKHQRLAVHCPVMRDPGLLFITRVPQHLAPTLKCQESFPFIKLFFFLMGMLILGEARHTWGQEVYGKSLVLPFNLTVALKLLWREK